MKVISCPICEVEDYEPVVVKNGYQVVRCKRCYLYFVNPQPDDGELKLFYERRQDSYLTDYSKKEESKLRAARREVKRILRLVKENQARILDVGCGCGFLLSEASSAGMDARGVDLSKSEVEYACQHFGVKAEWANFLDQDYQPEVKFKVITLFVVIEHWVNPAAGLTKCWNLLEPGGFLIVGTPDVSAVKKGRNFADWVELKPPEHLFFFSPGTLVKLAEKAGFHYYGDFWKLPWRVRIKAVFNKVGKK